MFQSGDKAVIDREWFKREIAASLKWGVCPRVVVQRTGVTPWTDTDTSGVPKGARWCQVKCEDTTIQLQVPEHHLNRPLPERSEPGFDIGPSKSRISWDLREKLREALCQMTLDWGDHHKRGTYWQEDRWTEPDEKKRQKSLIGHSGFGGISPSKEDIEAVIGAHEAGKALDRWIPVFSARVLSAGLCCPFCQDGGDFETNGLVIRPLKPCPNPDGLTTEWEMDFPSGKVIITDDLRCLCRIAGFNRDINTTWGTHLQILDYAKCGITIGFGIGNSSPGVFRMADGTYEIGRKMVEDDDDDWVDALPEGCVEVCSVCTDLWAYSIIDYDEAKRRADYYDLDLDKITENWTVHIVDIEPGRYRFQHYHGINRDAPDVTMARFERIGDANECDDWCARDAKFTVDITQAIQQRVGAWPTLYDEGRSWEQQCATVVSSELRGCVPERDWHRNGHRNSYLMADIEDIPIKELPRFRFQVGWDIARSVIDTTVSRNDELFGGDILLNDSYAIAAGYVLESAISFGLPTRRLTHKHLVKEDGEKVPNPRYNHYDVPEKRAEMHKAAKLWEGLIERYAHVAKAMPGFAAWMRNTKAVQLWIDNFDLGPDKYEAPESTKDGQQMPLKTREALAALKGE